MKGMKKEMMTKNHFNGVSLPKIRDIYERSIFGKLGENMVREFLVNFVK